MGWLLDTRSRKSARERRRWNFRNCFQTETEVASSEDKRELQDERKLEGSFFKGETLCVAEGVVYDGVYTATLMKLMSVWVRLF